MTIRIFRIRLDSNAFQMLLPRDESIWGLPTLQMDCKPKAEHWKPLDVYVQNPRLRRGNFFHLCSGAFAADDATSNSLLDLLEMSGELLPIVGETESLFLFNCLECVNCLDSGRTGWVLGKKTSAKIRIERYQFIASRLSEAPLFKIPETAPAELLTITGLMDPQDEFKNRVESARLGGLVFEEIWAQD